MNLVRESANQSKEDNSYIAAINSYWDSSCGLPVEKLEAFCKYVSRQALTKFLARSEVFNLQKLVNGSIVEVGVHRGASLMTWAHLSSIYEPVNYLRKIIGFDTFEGFPEVGRQDAKGSSEHLKRGGFDSGIDSLSDLEKSIELYDVNRLMNHIKKCDLVKGDVSESLPKYIEENPHLIVSLLHLDADLYKPTRVALELLLPRMPKGSVVLFDELNLNLFPGETIALLESFNLNRVTLRRFDYATSMSYIVIE